ncbi:hypothetical protein [Streptomyces sp. NPDC047028]|uniref:hypothetical protein n=1 Tax=Streptomyces sp. NPDC047028 TaxID=3155793 RepID=UPI0033D790BB
MFFMTGWSLTLAPVAAAALALAYVQVADEESMTKLDAASRGQTHCCVPEAAVTIVPPTHVPKGTGAVASSTTLSSVSTESCTETSGVHTVMEVPRGGARAVAQPCDELRRPQGTVEITPVVVHGWDSEPGRAETGPVDKTR